MSSDPHEHDESATEEELSEQEAELLPNREAMSIVSGDRFLGGGPLPFEPLAPGSVE